VGLCHGTIGGAKLKPFSSYQHLEGFPFTERDNKQIGSKFWNEGKWNNFVAPHIPTPTKEWVFVDMGCNAGLFLAKAEQLGFGKVIGVDSDKEAVKNGEKWRDEHGFKYQFRLAKMEQAINELPVADVTVLANAHYYFTINDWLDYLDKLQYMTRYVIIVTAEKRSKQVCWASADVPDIRYYFRGWEEVGFTDELPLEGDPDPRRLWSLCFKSPFIERMNLADIDCGNHVQDGFYNELESGKGYQETKYYHIIEKYRREKWSQEKIHNWFWDRVDVWDKVKVNWLTRPIYVDHSERVRVLDGNHRYGMFNDMGFKTILVRKT
jgi:SAM-dependent methyltransferase